MARKPFTLRSAVIIGTAASTGSAAGTLAERIVDNLGQIHSGIGQLAAAVTALWVLDKLNSLIDDDSDR
jgi:hypothetical protein